MRLSEAIRLGAMAFPQGTGGWMDNVEGRFRCALAGACEAIGLAGVDSAVVDSGRRIINYAELMARFPVLTQIATHPASGRDTGVLEIVFTLNDIYDWTREQIADWVETIEAQQPATESVTEEVTA